MNKKPEMYQNRVVKEFHNNKEIYTSYETNNTSTQDIRNKIYDIINSNTFIYTTKVNIIIGNDIITRKIIGIKGDNLITIDNEYIPLSKIKDIYK